MSVFFQTILIHSQLSNDRFEQNYAWNELLKVCLTFNLNTTRF